MLCSGSVCAAWSLQGIRPDRQREVLQYYQYSADRGSVEAQTAVGTLLNVGTHGVVRDHEAAAHYLQRAAASGNAEAMAHLGHMYGSGRGVPLVGAAACVDVACTVGVVLRGLKNSPLSRTQYHCQQQQQPTIEGSAGLSHVLVHPMQQSHSHTGLTSKLFSESHSAAWLCGMAGWHLVS